MKKCAYDTLLTIMSTKKLMRTLQNAPCSARKIKHTTLSIPTTTFLDANPFYHSWYHFCCHFPNMQYMPIRKESHFTCSHSDHLFHGKMTPAAWLLVATKTLDLRLCESATDDLRIPQIQMIYRTLCIHERLFLEAKTTLEVGTAKSRLLV